MANQPDVYTTNSSGPRRARRAWRSRMALTRRRVLAATIAGTLLIGGGLGVTVAFAQATPHAAQVANVCHSQVQEKIQWPLDPEYRVVAWCDSLDANTKARGVLDTRWDADRHTEWFTDTGAKHYSDWKIPLIGVTPDSRIELGTR
jgi:hypothetical protein